MDKYGDKMDDIYKKYVLTSLKKNTFQVKIGKKNKRPIYSLYLLPDLQIE